MLIICGIFFRRLSTNDSTASRFGWVFLTMSWDVAAMKVAEAPSGKVMPFSMRICLADPRVGSVLPPAGLAPAGGKRVRRRGRSRRGATTRLAGTPGEEIRRDFEGAGVLLGADIGHGNHEDGIRLDLVFHACELGDVAESLDHRDVTEFKGDLGRGRRRARAEDDVHAALGGVALHGVEILALDAEELDGFINAGARNCTVGKMIRCIFSIR